MSKIISATIQMQIYQAFPRHVKELVPFTTTDYHRCASFFPEVYFARIPVLSRFFKEVFFRIKGKIAVVEHTNLL